MKLMNVFGKEEILYQFNKLDIREASVVQAFGSIFKFRRNTHNLIAAYEIDKDGERIGPWQQFIVFWDEIGANGRAIGTRLKIQAKTRYNRAGKRVESVKFFFMDGKIKALIHTPDPLGNIVVSGPDGSGALVVDGVFDKNGELLSGDALPPLSEDFMKSIPNNIRVHSGTLKERNSR